MTAHGGPIAGPRGSDVGASEGRGGTPGDGMASARLAGGGL